MTKNNWIKSRLISRMENTKFCICVTNTRDRCIMMWVLKQLESSAPVLLLFGAYLLCSHAGSTCRLWLSFLSTWELDCCLWILGKLPLRQVHVQGTWETPSERIQRTYSSTSLITQRMMSNQISKIGSGILACCSSTTHLVSYKTVPFCAPPLHRLFQSNQKCIKFSFFGFGSWLPLQGYLKAAIKPKPKPKNRDIFSALLPSLSTQIQPDTKSMDINKLQSNSSSEYNMCGLYSTLSDFFLPPKAPWAQLYCIYFSWSLVCWAPPQIPH